MSSRGVAGREPTEPSRSTPCYAPRASAALRRRGAATVVAAAAGRRGLTVSWWGSWSPRRASNAGTAGRAQLLGVLAYGASFSLGRRSSHPAS